MVKVWASARARYLAATAVAAAVRKHVISRESISASTEPLVASWGAQKSMVQESHPLQQFFLEMVGRHYAEEIGLRDPQLIGYVAHLLTEFCDADQLFKIRNGAGRPLDDVGEMLMESDPVFGPAPSFDRERQVRKHIGDYTLFFTGMDSAFPDAFAGRGTGTNAGHDAGTIRRNSRRIGAFSTSQV